MIQKKKADDKADISVEEKLRALYLLQKIDSDIDKIRILRGELPLEVQDLEDEIAGLETRINNYNDETKSLQTAITNKKNEIKESESLIKKYENQQTKVRNNREYDSLSKEIEFQKLEIQLSQKRIKEFSVSLAEKKAIVEEATSKLKERQNDLEHKHSELDEIISETKREEEVLKEKSKKTEKIIENRLLTAYKRIRANARNGLAVVAIERNACGGCFNKIPPQRQLDIATRKKIIVCEYCGRILVDKELREEETEKLKH